MVSLMRLDATSRCFTLKSTPMVDCMCSSKESSVNRSSMEDWVVMSWIKLDLK